MVFLSHDATPGTIDELSKLPMMIVLAGYAAVAAGLAIVYCHNRWTAGWPMLISAVGRLSVVMCFIRIAFPMEMAAVMVKARPPSPVVLLPIVGAAFLLIGGALSFKAYRRE
jgi:hypothetical protein